MIINSADFVISNTDVQFCPKTDLPEYAFIGRSNVGKSSLINMLTQNNKLALISSKPGKTMLINHFLINNAWFLVDLPGYGFAKTGKASRERLQKMINSYILLRSSLVNLFVLIDSRLEPQQIDLQFMEWLGIQGVPFSIVFTKMDKLSTTRFLENRKKYEETLLQSWETLPVTFQTSSKMERGREEILGYIETLNQEMAHN
jgi:GTP-binding protein